MRCAPILACMLAAALMAISIRADALPLPEPREDVTKLTKPTISYDNGSDEIRLMDWDGTNDRLYIGDGKARYSSSIVWAPDGKHAAAVVVGGGAGFTPWVLNLETGRAKNMLDWLPEGKGKYIHPAWSPDGRWLTLAASRRITNLILHGDIYNVNVRNGRYVRVTNIPRLDPETLVGRRTGKRLRLGRIMRRRNRKMLRKENSLITGRSTRSILMERT